MESPFWESASALNSLEAVGTDVMMTDVAAMTTVDLTNVVSHDLHVPEERASEQL